MAVKVIIWVKQSTPVYIILNKILPDFFKPEILNRYLPDFHKLLDYSLISESNLKYIFFNFPVIPAQIRFPFMVCKVIRQTVFIFCHQVRSPAPSPVFNICLYSIKINQVRHTVIIEKECFSKLLYGSGS